MRIKAIFPYVTLLFLCVTPGYAAHSTGGELVFWFMAVIAAILLSIISPMFAFFLGTHRLNVTYWISGFGLLVSTYLLFISYNMFDGSSIFYVCPIFLSFFVSITVAVIRKRNHRLAKPL